MENTKKYMNEYESIVKKHSPRNKVVLNSIKAFIVGGLICILGQFLTDIYKNLGLSVDEAATFTTDSLIAISVILTGLNVYDNIGQAAGAGALIPITGFANSMASAAMEYKKEGYIYGLGAKLFTIAGPVIVYGTIASVLIGIIYFFI